MIELRTVSGEQDLDEVVAECCHVHLERMDKGSWSLILEGRRERVILNIFRKRKQVLVAVFERDAKP